MVPCVTPGGRVVGGKVAPPARVMNIMFGCGLFKLCKNIFQK